MTFHWSVCVSWYSEHYNQLSDLMFLIYMIITLLYQRGSEIISAYFIFMLLE